jgi:hypothetical protein
MSAFSNFGGGAASSTGASTGTSSFGGFSSFSSIGTPYDVNSSEGLLNLARSQGGALADTAEELAHPTTGILSSIGNGVKTAFKGFIDVLAMPSQVVAGTISSEYTIGEAIDQNIAPSDVIFGAKDPNATVMQKTGSFLTRTAVDILLDPLTYVTFGTGKGALLGASAVSKISLETKAAETIGKVAGDTLALNDEGVDIYKYLSKVERQQTGLLKGADLADRLTAFKEGKAAREALEASGKLTAEQLDFTAAELKKLVGETIDAPLNIDYAKRAMTKMLEKFPTLTEDIMDKGGIKFFNQSILSGQRISSAMKLIPGATALDHFTTPARNSINALFDTRMVKMDNNEWIRLPEEYNLFEQAAKDLAESMKDDRVRGLGTVVRANKLDVNEAKLLFASVEAGKIPADARLAKAYKQLIGFNDEELNSLRRAGIPIAFRDKHVPHMLVKTNMKIPSFSASAPSEKVGAALGRKLDGTVFNTDFQRLEALEGAVLSKDAEKINKALEGLKNDGFEIFDDNIVTALAARSVENTKAITTRNFLDGLAKNFATTADQAPPGWVPLNLSSFKNEEEFLNKIGRSTETLRFHPAIAKKVENFVGNIINDDATNDALKAYDSLQNFWKASVTSIFPAFHGRNALSNVFMHFNDIGAASLDPRNHVLAGSIVKMDRDLVGLQLKAAKGDMEAADKVFDLTTKKVFTDATGHSWSFGELRQVMKNNNIAFNKNITGSLDVTRSPEEAARALFPMTKKDVKGAVKKALPVSNDFVGFEVGREVGRAIEEQARVMDFMVNLRNTGDVSLASMRTKQFLFDYQNLTAFEKTFMRRLMPFYTFTRKNIEMQVNTLMTTPGRTSAQVTALTNLGDAISGQELTPEEEAALPDWIKSGISILKKKEGGIAEIYGSLATPLEAPFSAIQPNNALGSLSPLLRVPIETASGYDFFRGKPISEVTNATAFVNAPQAVKNLIGFQEVKVPARDGKKGYTLYMSLRPEMMHVLLNLPPTSRVFTAMKQLEDQNVSDGSKTLQMLMGVKAFSFDTEVEAQKRENELKKKLSDLLTTAGVTGQFQRTYISKPKESKFGGFE